MGLIKYLIGFAFLSVFAIAIISFSVGYGYNNDAAINLNEDEYFNANVMNASLKSDLAGFKTDADSSFDILKKSSIASGDENVEGGGQFKTGPSQIIDTANSILSTTNKRIFGQGSEFSFIFTTILGFIVFVSGLYIWKTWRGDPD